MTKIRKTLSANDTAQTGSHQAGMLVPKEPAILSFFPALVSTEKNPRHHIQFEDESGGKWEFAFIYYNNALFGGTRNEYRLTRMTKYIRGAGLIEGDQVVLERVGADYFVSYVRSGSKKASSDRLVLGSGWALIDV
jgi:Restriction endonuclease EcoRII, N-terminal